MIKAIYCQLCLWHLKYVESQSWAAMRARYQFGLTFILNLISVYLIIGSFYRPFLNNPTMEISFVTFLLLGYFFCFLIFVKFEKGGKYKKIFSKASSNNLFFGLSQKRLAWIYLISSYVVLVLSFLFIILSIT